MLDGNAIHVPASASLAAAASTIAAAVGLEGAPVAVAPAPAPAPAAAAAAAPTSHAADQNSTISAVSLDRDIFNSRVNDYERRVGLNLTTEATPYGNWPPSGTCERKWPLFQTSIGALAADHIHATVSVCVGLWDGPTGLCVPDVWRLFSDVTCTHFDPLSPLPSQDGEVADGSCPDSILKAKVGAGSFVA